MANKIFDFKTPQERDDTFIALFVVLLFVAFILRYTGCSESDINNIVPELNAAPAVVTNNSSDRDGDGIINVNDKCPNIAGLEINNGCPPDADGDGLHDQEDKCPEQAGKVINNGCPMDRDGDGVVDSKDNCPKLKGEAKNNGCPLSRDSDGDGTMNEKDKCPNIAGSKDNNGCPLDADNDGIPDKYDNCPEKAGVKSNKGCPLDADGDGIADKDDKCPNEKGTLRDKGCPVDTDRDGVYDKDDKCPRLKGIATNGGCPPDSDGDGIYDKDDRCPNKKGIKANNGCPEVVIEKADKEILDKAIQNVEFQVNRATLKPSSVSILDQVVTILKKYPDYKVSISGHTDNVGNDAENMTLSTERAKTCYNYFIGKGINKNRLSYKGFGETKPKAPNDTAANKRKNRRVEFELNY